MSVRRDLPIEGPDREELERRLDALAADERGVLAESAALDEAPGLDRVDAALEAAWAQDAPTAGADVGPASAAPDEAPSGATSAAPATPAPTSLGRRGWLAAAALLVAIALLWRSQQVPPPPEAPILLGDGLALVQPVGAVERYAPIVWSHPSPDGLTFALRVTDPSVPGPAGLLLETPRRRDLRWSGDAATTWPSRVLLEIDAYDGSGALVDSLAAEVQRR